VSDRAELLYEEARAVPAGERARFIADACGDDDTLREELEGLLGHADAAEGLFERLAGVVSGKPVVADRYEVLGCIGAGGMGTVYRAWDLRLQRDVALKFLPPDLTATPDAEAVLLREARAAASVEHPNICTVHDAASGDGRPFISMAYYDGETLKDRLRRAPMPLHEAVSVALQLARALAAAHARGIVHRDVKPGNVMLVTEGPVKLLDFGIARLKDATVTGLAATPGTVAYMAPEQARGDPVGPGGDLFSLGVVVYEMTAGMHPFRRDDPHAIVDSILHDEPPPLRQRNPAAPAALERIVRRLLRKDPADRYSSAGAVVADLERLAPQPALRAAGWSFPLLTTRARRAAAVGVRAIGVAAVSSPAWLRES
jgi:serine/threonine-protein kinase